ncbi:MAG: sulfatase-like hydrolase/transferase [Planctomycetes bacterium]|nr:sulfatase-like hydrolase/transferase [Planctomycetota bacterium]
MPIDTDPPLVLMVCIDALRYDCVNWQPETPYFEKIGLPRRLTTPTLDAIGNESVRFQRAVAPAGYTPLSLATTLTGVYADTHGVVDFQNTTCRADVRPLGSLFKRLGWRTCSVWGPEFFKGIGLARDVDHVFNDEAVLLDLLDSGPPEPTFAFVHLNDVHHPYVFNYWDDPRADNRDFELMMLLQFGLWVDLEKREFIDASGRRAPFDQWSQLIATPGPPEAIPNRLGNLFKCYLHGIQKFDQTRLAAFVERLKAGGWWDRAVVVFFADHGEVIWPTVPWTLGHGKLVCEQLMRVPLTIKAPGIAPRDVRTLVGLVDLVPTVLALAGADLTPGTLPYELAGRSLLPAIEHDRPVQNDYYHEGWSVLVAEQKRKPALYQRAIRTQDDRKFLFSGDLLDPAQFESLAEDDFLQYAIERALGEMVYPPTEAAVRQHLVNGMSRRDVAAGLAAQVPRYRRFDLKTDPFEERGQPMEPGRPGWDEYLRQLKRMVDLRGQPCYVDESTELPADEERELLRHLGELGYVEAT